MVCHALAKNIQDTGTTFHSSCQPQGVHAFGVSRQAVSIMELPMHPAASNWHDSCTPLAQRFSPPFQGMFGVRLPARWPVRRETRENVQ